MNTLKFDELDADGKERARNWYRSAGLDYRWWDCVEDNAKTAGTCLGITVDRLGFDLYGVAAFNGHYGYRTGWRKALRKEFGGDALRELDGIGEALQNAQKGAFYQLIAKCSITPRGNLQVTDVERADDVRTSDEAEHAISRALGDFAHWIYRALRDEFEWLNADEQVDDTIRANGYEFDARGNAI